MTIPTKLSICGFTINLLLNRGKLVTVMKFRYYAKMFLKDFRDFYDAPSKYYGKIWWVKYDYTKNFVLWSSSLLCNRLRSRRDYLNFKNIYKNETLK